VRGRLLRSASWLACHLPERPLVALADLAGDLWYRVTPERADLARRNLRRVVAWLASRDRGTAMARRAADDPRTLERLVRLAYRHAARYYLEVARTPAVGPEDIAARVRIETPDEVESAFLPGRAAIFVGLHFGAIELPALYLATRAGAAVSPMETLDDPDLQAWFVRTRGAAGVRIVGLREARRELTAALRAGTSVGIVGDRDLTGGGTLIELFGAPARLPLGPALLAVETDAPLYVAGVRRDGPGRYIGRIEPVAVPSEGSRRERAVGTTATIARAFERVIADAPEQWWAIFFPIWPDLETGPDAPAERGPDARDAGAPGTASAVAEPAPEPRETPTGAAP
jgi:KDO2-lipid IV(A) lauroyltransferase